MKYNLSNFNSHPHKEDDTLIRFQFILLSDISTHILTRRMTLLLLLMLLCSQYFNSHPHKEDDFYHFVTFYFLLTFQLTSSQGG